jgi:hypothetical protein
MIGWYILNFAAMVEHLRDSLKINAFCALNCDEVHKSFFFGEETVNAVIYSYMLEL